MYKETYDKYEMDYRFQLGVLVGKQFNNFVIGLPADDVAKEIKELRIAYEAKKKREAIKGIIRDL